MTTRLDGRGVLSEGKTTRREVASADTAARKLDMSNSWIREIRIGQSLGKLFGAGLPAFNEECTCVVAHADPSPSRWRWPTADA
jgi:hypothetical protein